MDGCVGELERAGEPEMSHVELTQGVSEAYEGLNVKALTPLSKGGVISKHRSQYKLQV